MILNETKTYPLALAGFNLLNLQLNDTFTTED